MTYGVRHLWHKKEILLRFDDPGTQVFLLERAHPILEQSQPGGARFFGVELGGREGAIFYRCHKARAVFRPGHQRLGKRSSAGKFKFHRSVGVHKVEALALHSTKKHAARWRPPNKKKHIRSMRTWVDSFFITAAKLP